MREIKFRARIKGITAPFIFGSLRVDDGRTYIGWQNENGWFEDEVDPESVGQFTGLLDKNGVEVYEGDIVVCDSRRCVVVWQQSDCSFRYQPEFGVSSFYVMPYNGDEEVIGNIYEHPNLLSDTNTLKENE